MPTLFTVVRLEVNLPQTDVSYIRRRRRLMVPYFAGKDCSVDVRIYAARNRLVYNDKLVYIFCRSLYLYIQSGELPNQGAVSNHSLTHTTCPAQKYDRVLDVVLRRDAQLAHSVIESLRRDLCNKIKIKRIANEKEPGGMSTYQE